MNAGNAGRHQQLREASFAGGRTERHAVKQDLIARSTQQHAATAAVFQRLAQLFPRRIKLLRRLHMAKLVEARKFQQNVQAANKRARSALCFRIHASWPGFSAFSPTLTY